MICIWLAAIIVLLAIEAATVNLVSIWFALGSVAGLACELLGAPIIVQLIAFLVVSLTTVIFTRPFAQKFVNDKVQHTNADSLIGKTIMVSEDIDNMLGSGEVVAEGKRWAAKDSEGKHINKGTFVVVERIEGVKLVVHPENTDKEV